ncbi:MAG TPA: WhiB family transcriptional regulator [Actinopolymorphaceae bacterium]|jgi:hypothetical protein
MSTGWTMEASEDGERVLLPASAARVLETVIEPDWTVDAACVSVDPELWFPEIGGTTSRAVLEICASCPVRRTCLASAIVNVEDGIWGGVQAVPRSQARGQIWRGADPLVVLDELLDRAAETDSRRRFAA